MQEFLTVFLLLGIYFPVTLLINRLYLLVFPARRDAPGQGSITASAILSLFMALLFGLSCLGDSLPDKVIWFFYLAVVVGSMAMVYVSVLCVSESGRRFYLMHLIADSGGIQREDLRRAYTSTHMMDIRLQRLTTWKVLEKNGSRYRLRRKTAWLYSSFFHWWGRLLGFTWF